MVVLIERLLPDDGAADPVSLADLNVLVLLSGPERTLREYGNLLARAGLRLNRVIGSAPPFSFIEASAGLAAP
jgi:hypothetical protein